MKKKNIVLSLLLIFFSSILSISAQESSIRNKAIKNLIKKKREYNKVNKKGYRIQIYNGLEKKAKSIKRSFQVEFPGIYSRLSYKNPEWKVQVGNYKTRLQADRSLNKFREKFYGAIVIPL